GLRAGGTEQATERASDESEAPAGKTVVFGVPGLTMNDIDRERTPNLYRLLSEGAAANLNVRTIGSATCPASGWLSFGAGARAQAGPSPAAEEADEGNAARCPARSEEHTSELQSRFDLVCRLLLEKKKE